MHICPAGKISKLSTHESSLARQTGPEKPFRPLSHVGQIPRPIPDGSGRGGFPEDRAEDTGHSSEPDSGLHDVGKLAFGADQQRSACDQRQTGQTSHCRAGCDSQPGPEASTTPVSERYPPTQGRHPRQASRRVVRPIETIVIVAIMKGSDRSSGARLCSTPTNTPASAALRIMTRMRDA